MTGKISKAYPNYDQYMAFSSPYDTNRWLEGVKSMYFFIHKGLEKTAAFEKVTSGWSDMEKRDFTQWLKFYEANNHKKYSQENDAPIQKMAQVSYWQDVNRAGYFVPIEQHAPQSPASQIDAAKNPETNTHAIEEEKRDLIEKQRTKILSRLDSTEKLIRSREGQVFVGKELEVLLEIIHGLKRKIQTVNKISVASKIYEDIIIREANILTRKGFTKAASLIIKVADETPGTVPAPTPPPDSMVGGAGLPGSLPGAGPGLTPPPNNPPASVLSGGEEPLAQGMKEFLEGTKTNKMTSEEDLEVNDTEDNNLVVEAQAAPPPAAEAPAAPKEKADIEVEEEVTTAKDFDNLVDRAFANLTVSDVVNKLEDLAKIFKVREVPRQLAMIDMMLDRLGLAALFPTLAEAMNKSLDSNQYIASRIEDILSRLRGTLEGHTIDLKTETPANSPEALAVKQKLENDDAKEKERKRIRKEQENLDLESGDAPEAEIEVEEDLAAPAKLTNKMPEAAPAAVPAPAPAAKPPAPVR